MLSIERMDNVPSHIKLHADSENLRRLADFMLDHGEPDVNVRHMRLLTRKVMRRAAVNYHKQLGSNAHKTNHSS